jgi:2-succinyl-6-hydroxy-2,4-cyclohexadiene-1-carboxylate synthase
MPYANLGTLRLYYEITGSGPSLVLIAGWTLNTHFWDALTPSLSRRHSVLAYDVRGTGRSTSDSSLEYSRVADAEDLAHLLDDLQIERAHLVGHSKGARIALTFAMLHPERALTVTAIGSAEPHGAPDGQRAFRPIAQAWVFKAREIAMRVGPDAATAYLAQGKLFGKLRTSVEGVRRLHRAMEGYAAADLVSDTPRREVDSAALVANLNMPILFLVGQDDPFLQECEYAHGQLSTSVLLVVPGGGHMLPLEAPGPVAQCILHWLATVSSCSTLGTDS